MVTQVHSIRQVCRVLQVLRMRISKGAGAAGRPMQRTAALGTPEECLAIVHLGNDAAADTSSANGVCEIKPGAFERHV